MDGTNYLSNFPLTKIFQGENIDNPWIGYFVMELPANVSTKNIRIEMELNTSIEYEVYARFGGLASHEMYDYYYVNQINNSDDGLSLFKLYASSNQSLKFDIVYAQQGKWSFGLRKRNLMTRLESETNLSISLAACPNNCSGYGKCSIAANAQTSCRLTSCFCAICIYIILDFILIAILIFHFMFTFIGVSATVNVIFSMVDLIAA